MESAMGQRSSSGTGPLRLIVGAAAGFVAGAALGLIEGSVQFMNSFSLAALVLAGAALGFLVGLRVRRGALTWALGILLGLALLGGYYSASYQIFHATLTAQINNQLSQQNIVPIPAAVNAQIDQILKSSTGMGGFAGFLVLKMTENGAPSMLLFVARLVLVVAAALVTARAAGRGGA